MNRPDDWLFSAGLDLRAARASAKEGISNIACFLSQQTVEKAFKAVILRKSKTVPRLHNLIELLDKVILINPQLKEFEGKIHFLNQFYIPTRYPDAFPGSLPEGLPSIEMAQRAIESAQEVLDFIRNLFSQNSP